MCRLEALGMCDMPKVPLADYLDHPSSVKTDECTIRCQIHIFRGVKGDFFLFNQGSVHSAIVVVVCWFVSQQCCHLHVTTWADVLGTQWLSPRLFSIFPFWIVCSVLISIGVGPAAVETFGRCQKNVSGSVASPNKHGTIHRLCFEIPTTDFDKKRIIVETDAVRIGRQPLGKPSVVAKWGLRGAAPRILACTEVFSFFGQLHCLGFLSFRFAPVCLSFALLSSPRPSSPFLLRLPHAALSQTVLSHVTLLTQNLSTQRCDTQICRTELCHTQLCHT